jgi:hypothetical protein
MDAGVSRELTLADSPAFCGWLDRSASPQANRCSGSASCVGDGAAVTDAASRILDDALGLAATAFDVERRGAANS